MSGTATQAERPPRGGLLRRLRAPSFASLLHRGAWGLADQGLLSAASFVTLALVARASSLHDFGIFSLAFTFINLEMAVSAALLSEPFVVISASYEKARYAAYVTSTYVLHFGFGLVVAALIAAFAGLDLALGWGNAGLLLLIIPAMLCWQLQDFTRQPLYVEGRVAAAFLNDLVSYGGQMAVVAVAYYFGFLSIHSALVIVAVCCGVAFLFGLFQLRNSVAHRVTFATIKASAVETWMFSRWVLGGTFLTSASVYLQPFILALFRGAPAAGELRAMMVLMGPARIIIRGIGTAFTPLAAATLEREGKGGLASLMKKMLVLGTPLMGLYCLAVSVRPTALVTAFFGSEYAASASWLLPLIALSFVLLVVVMPLDIGLRSLRVTNPLFRAGVWNFIVFWCVGVPAIFFFGLLGAALTSLLTPLVVGIELRRHYRREMQSVTGAAPQPSEALA